MSLTTVPIGGTYHRVADPAWSDPLDASFASNPPGQRWNPPGVACLYLNCDVATARANVASRFAALPYGPEDLDPATAPLLVEVSLPAGRAADAFTDSGLVAAGLPTTYPQDADGTAVAHSACQPVGRAAFDSGLDGVVCRSAVDVDGRELAWFPRSEEAAEMSRLAFTRWW